MYNLQEIAWEKNNLSSSAMDSKHFRINFYHEVFDPLRPIDSKRDHQKAYKLFIGSQRPTLMQELNNQNVAGYCCILDETFFSLIENASSHLPLFSSLKHKNECSINIPAIKLERFILIFDLIYFLFNSSARHKAILIASYLLVILKEADYIFEESNRINEPNM
jgi:hypothetical protein